MKQEINSEQNYIKKDIIKILALFILFAGIFTVIYITDQNTGNLSEIAKQLYSTFVN